ncbi:MAG: hypothetical protein MGG11_21555 [Trichodesmium sp. MAG_R03]|nr:hypothetical protein [Trichodesmium sp. MAG_R03]
MKTQEKQRIYEEVGARIIPLEEVGQWEKIWNQAYKKPKEDWDSNLHGGG